MQLLWIISQDQQGKGHEAYDSGWKHWETWCEKQNPQQDPQKYNTTNVLKLLIDNQHYSSIHLNTLRSVIASVFRVLYPNELPIANQPLIQSFFATKRRSEIRIPFAQQLSTWDTNKIITYLERHWADSKSVSLTQLQLKTIAILCLATVARPRSDLGRLQKRDIHLEFDNDNVNEPKSVTIHFREPKETQVKSSQFGIIKHSSLCPVITLSIFLERTRTLRTALPKDHTLFLSYIEQPEKNKFYSTFNNFQLCETNHAFIRY
jgi:hypothetical protein